MKRKFHWILLLPLVAFSMGCADQPSPEEPCNFVTNQYSRRVSWARMPVQFYVDSQVSDQQRDAIIEAMEVWNNAFDRPVFQYIGRVLPGELPPPALNADGRVIPDGYNGIYVVDKDVFENTASKDEQARTSISFRGDFIYEADILIDASEQFYFEDRELQSSAARIHFKSLMIHELGHVLGLEHIEENNDSVMNPTLQFGELRQDIAPIDFQSLSCEYQ